MRSTLHLSALLLILLGLIPICMLGQTSIFGTVNEYAKVNSITGSSLDVATTTGFAPGDKILVIQMKGAAINTSTSSAFGDITGYGSAGLYEYTTIDMITGSTIELDNVLCNIYDISGCVQIVRVAQYTDAVVTAPVGCPNWNGSTGGVISIEVSGILTLNADINASGRGFRGGNICSGGFSCGDINWFSGLGLFGCQGGEKGEGIANYIMGMENSRGKLANGGGGSNQGNCGAGGGSNFGEGGHGGDFYTGCGPTMIWGAGGTALSYASDIAFLGGGGGGGFRDNGQTTAPGVSGGGIIIIEGGDLIGAGNSIISNGSNVVLVTNDEGAGGGGAGGTVLLKIDNVIGLLNVEASGGSGGNSQNFIFSGQCHGPGGGGGGGYIGTELPTWPIGVTTTVNGGAPGAILHTTGSCGFPSTNGAQPGLIGGVLFGLAPSLAGPVIDLGNDTTVCAGASITFDAGSDFISFLWQDSSTLQDITVITPGVITIEVSNTCGTAYDTVEVFHNPLPIVLLGPDVSFCLGEDTTFNAGTGFASYLWNDGSASQTFTTALEGSYIVEVTDAFGCANRDTVEVIEVFALPEVDLGLDISICEGEEASFDAGAGLAAYSWSTGSASASIVVSDTGYYEVLVTDINNCAAFDGAELLFLPVEECESFVTIPNAFTPNGDGLNDLFMPFAEGANLLSFEIHIFNRWGDVIFYSNDENKGWDGTYKGENAGLETYVYVLNAEGIREGAPIPIKRQGTLTLLR